MLQNSYFCSTEWKCGRVLSAENGLKETDTRNKPERETVEIKHHCLEWTVNSDLSWERGARSHPMNQNWWWDAGEINTAEMEGLYGYQFMWLDQEDLFKRKDSPLISPNRIACDCVIQGTGGGHDHIIPHTVSDKAGLQHRGVFISHLLI